VPLPREWLVSGFLLWSACAQEGQPLDLTKLASGRGGSASTAGRGGSGASARPGSGGAGKPQNPLLADPDAGAGGSSRRNPGKPETCDGTDDDANGIIDDLDVDGDGVCDCLRIATIGQIGPWSNGGNVLKTWLNARSATPAVELGDQVLTEQLLEPFQVIVVLYVGEAELSTNGQTLRAHHVISASEAEALRQWVARGGGVMSTIGYLSDMSIEARNVNRLLRPLEITYRETAPQVNGMIEDWESHPITQGVTRVATHTGAEPIGAAGSALARDAQDVVALRVREYEKGHVLVWGDEWITYDSEWQSNTQQQVERLWLNSFKWLTPANMCQVPLL